VDLVVYAFQNGNPGDTFVQKAPACTLDTLALSLKSLLHADNPVSVIGTRHGEKLFETLLTREEMAVAEDLGGYFRVPADNRDLNYAQFFSEGREEIAVQNDFNSHNTVQKDVDGMCELLLKLECVQQAMRGIRIAA
jgi:UDP-N-acetylglucosamine 4,6-dehydratase